MIQLIRDLGPIRSGTVCDGLDRTVDIIREELPFMVHEFASGVECNGWTVPWKWECQKAIIRGHGSFLYDGNAHPLGVASYSNSFTGMIPGVELKKYLFYSAVYPDAIIYHCDWWYKQHARSWGFCVTKTFFDSIVDDVFYDVDLQTTFTPGTMKVAEQVLVGNGDCSIVLNAHSCHPGCANDDLSGIAVGIEVMRRLARIPTMDLTVRLIVAPEHYGSIFYLDRFGQGDIRAALFLESLGTTGPLALQHSFNNKEELIDHALVNAVIGTAHYRGEFRSIVGNDETCWDSAGYAIPCPSLSRCPFTEYHTSLDNADLMSLPHLEEAVQVVMRALLALDRNAFLERVGKPGLVCLSNPAIDLYQPYFDPSIADRRTITDHQKEWNRLMNFLPRYFDSQMTILDIANKHGLPFDAVYQYVKQWESKGLVKLTD